MDVSVGSHAHGSKLEDSSLNYIKVFNLAELGVNQDSFLKAILPTYESLTWDYYDVRREQINLIQQHGKQLSVEEQVLLRNYYCGTVSYHSVLHLVERLNSNIQQMVEAVTPYRRRHVTSFFCRCANSNKWNIEVKKSNAVAQNVNSFDYRSIQRIFPPINDNIWNQPEFQSLLQGLAKLTAAARSGIKAFEATCWQNGIIARGKKSASNSPEGIHQDGSDYIVSALVLERRNIKGGTSRIFGPDKKTIVLEHTLMPGEGIFQADNGSSLWHDVTPVTIDDTTQEIGIRNILGFDVNILKA